VCVCVCVCVCQDGRRHAGVDGLAACQAFQPVDIHYHSSRGACTREFLH